MANSYTGADILKGTLQKAGELADGSSSYIELGLKFINNIYYDLLSASSMFDVDIGDPFPWARSSTPLSILLKAPYETGTVSLTNGSTSGTFSSAPSAALGSFVNRFIKMDQDPEFYRIVSHTAGATAFTLDLAFVGETGAALTFKAHKLIYDLGSNILRLCEPMRVYQDQGFDADEDLLVTGIEANTLRADWPLARLTQAVPSRFATIYQSDTEYLVQFNSSVSADTKLDCDYVPIPTDIINSESSIPVIPRERRKILEFGGAHLLCVEKGMGEKATYYLGAAKAELNALMRSKNKTMRNVSRSRGRLIARADEINRFRGSR